VLLTPSTSHAVSNEISPDVGMIFRVLRFDKATLDSKLAATLELCREGRIIAHFAGPAFRTAGERATALSPACRWQGKQYNENRQRFDCKTSHVAPK
jgi:hypothetical protein